MSVDQPLPTPTPPVPSRGGRRRVALGGCSIFLVLFFVGAGGCLLITWKSITQEPAEVDAIAQEILPSTIPPGAEEVFARSLLGFLKEAAFVYPGPVQLYLKQVPETATLPSIDERELDPERVKVLESRTEEARVRGEPAKVAVLVVEMLEEGKEPEEFTEYTTIVAVGESAAFVLFQGPTAEVPISRFQEFLDSVR